MEVINQGVRPDRYAQVLPPGCGMRIGEQNSLFTAGFQCLKKGMVSSRSTARGPISVVIAQIPDPVAHSSNQDSTSLAYAVLVILLAHIFHRFLWRNSVFRPHVSGTSFCQK